MGAELSLLSVTTVLGNLIGTSTCELSSLVFTILLVWISRNFVEMGSKVVNIKLEEETV